MEEKFYVTEEGLSDLKKELDTLIHVTREEVIEELKAARAQGDLSENADYDAARDHQAKVESRIKELEHLIKNAEIITETKKTNFVRIGSTVEVQELDTKNILTYKIVGSVEADPLNGLLSNVTPLAEAILDQRVNDVVTVKVDPPYDVKILKIS
ncbi:MAG: transcription elongation factor GreA [Erysipelotrichaceae bacterium]|jgi:transcription elongation factor GreA|nr:transcription elongation factor GreA [Erysipelotrichaceae bacterium]